MKKNFLYSVMALFAVLFASCSQEEIVSGTGVGQNGQVTITVGVPGEKTHTRAMSEIGNTVRRCIMQVVNASTGVAIEGEGMRQTAKVTGEKVTFTFQEPKDNYKCLFWADYVAKEPTSEGVWTDNFYATTDLTNITQKMTKNVMFNAPACDAFCGAMEKGNTSITLKRPFSKIILKTDDPSAFEDYNRITISNFNVPDGYNVLNKTTAATKAIRLEETDMADVVNGVFASFFAFAPISETEVTTDMTITISSTSNSKEPIQAKVTSLPTDENKIVNLNIKNTAGQATVEVSFGDEFDNKPTEPANPNAIAVGSYINAEGKVVTDANDAIAVVFAMAEGKADYSTYADSKKAKAYAISLDKVTNRVAVGDLSSFNLAITNDDAEGYSGFAFDAALKAKLGSITSDQSKLFNAYYTAVLPNLSGNNLSSWYIPSTGQLTDALKLDNETLKANLQAAYSGNFYCATSSVALYKEVNSVFGVLYKRAEEIADAPGGLQATTSALIFPVLTIFE